MKICAVICEYNPFHNGHLYQLREMKRLSGCDKLLCLMSGNFTQRGEAAVLDKYTRARHAVLAGADAVLELPAAFACSPAELFAGGAVHILAAIPAVSFLAFGCESGDKDGFLAAARASSDEGKAFRQLLKENMRDGTGYAAARTKTVLALNTDIDEALLTSPNNLLGTEYCCALIKEHSQISPLPIPRIGGGYADTALLRDFSSATALRAALQDPSKKVQKLVKHNVPSFVYEDLLGNLPTAYETAALLALLRTPNAEIAETPDCSEGLENRIRLMARSNPDYKETVNKVVTKRYTASRVRRVILQNFLHIRQKDVKAYLSAPLYLRTLAVKKEGADELLAALAESAFPLLARRSDLKELKKEAAACLDTDLLASQLYAVLSKKPQPDFETLFI